MSMNDTMHSIHATHAKNPPKPTAEQLAIHRAITSDTTGCHIISGHAGTGKTYLISGVINTLLKDGKTVQVLAPTAAALAVLENRLGTHHNLQYRTIAAVMHTTRDALSLGDTAPTFPLDHDGLIEFAGFMDTLGIDHTRIITAWDTTNDTPTTIDCANPAPIVSTPGTHIDVDLPTLTNRLATLFAGSSPFAPQIVTTTRTTTAGECANRISNHWQRFPDAVIVDEFSMVNDTQATIITTATKNRGALFIGCGDPHQLQPVTGDPNVYLTADTAPSNTTVHVLTRPLRSDNHIINLATDIRNGTRFNDLAIAGDITLTPTTDPDTLVDTMPDLFTTADVVISYRNSTIESMNRALRRLWKLDGTINLGEQLVCNANVLTYDGYAFRNGELFTITNTEPPSTTADLATLRDYATDHAGGMIDTFITLVDRGLIRGVEVTDERATTRPAFVWTDPTGTDEHTHRALTRALHPLICDNTITSCLIDVSFAYALTVHKAQGSEWDNVIYLASQKDLDIQRTTHAPYTAVTRAKHELTVLYSR